MPGDLIPLRGNRQRKPHENDAADNCRDADHTRLQPQDIRVAAGRGPNEQTRSGRGAQCSERKQREPIHRGGLASLHVVTPAVESDDKDYPWRQRPLWCSVA